MPRQWFDAYEGHTMTIRIVIGVLLSAALTTVAHAQSFDGVYKGTRKITKDLAYVTGTRTECQAVGRNYPVEFHVAGSTITMRYLDYAHQVSGTIAGDGSFKLEGLYTQHIGSAGAGRPTGTWTGRIVGSRLSGTLFARLPAGECHGDFSARK
jgi:hypothetical protein